MLTSIPPLPFDVVNIILQYDGRIKYSHKDRIYVNIISKRDYRYSMLKRKVTQQLNLINLFQIGNDGLQYYMDIHYEDDEIGLLFTMILLP